MAGPTQDDLERQFQADLERAAALSMETLALDEFKRKQRNSGGRSEQPQLDFSTARQSTISEQQQQRRRSNETTTSTSRNTAAPDLISFSGPDPNPVDLASPQSNGGAAAAAAAPAPDKHTSFVQYVDQIHQITAQQQQYLARMPQSTAITPFGRPPLGIPIAGPAGMQLMPYQAPPPSQPVAQTQPLTPDNLQKLYNSPYYGHSAGVSPFPRFPGHQYVASAVAANQAQVAAPYPGHLPQSVMNQQVHNTPLSTAPVSSASPAAAASVMGYNPVGYGGSTTANTPSHPYQPTPPTGMGFVQNPESALVHVPKQAPTLTPSAAVVPGTSGQSSATANGGSMSSNYTVAPRARRPSEKVADGNLIDLDGLGQSLDKVSVLEAFDPLMNNDLYNDKADTMSDCTTYYSEYDPFDYLYSGSGTQYSDPVYEAVIRSDQTPMSPGSTISGPPPAIGWNIPGGPLNPPPLPPRNSFGNDASTSFQDQTQPQAGNLLYDLPQQYPPATLSSFSSPENKRRVPSKLYENVVVRKAYDPELMAFYHMVLNVRNEFQYTDVETNRGHVVAQEFSEPHANPDMSIKVLVHPAREALTPDLQSIYSLDTTSAAEGITLRSSGQGQIPGYGPPVTFTFELNKTVDHVRNRAFFALENTIQGDLSDFALKIIGVVEYLSPTAKLSHLEYIHQCIKLEKDVQLALCTRSGMSAIARTKQDDIRDAELKPEDVIAHEKCSTISYDTLMILLETLETEIDRLESAAVDTSPHTVVSCSGVIQGVKAICAHLGNIDTLDISEAIQELSHTCASGQTKYSYKEGAHSGHKMDIISEQGDYAEVSLRPRTIGEQVRYRCNQVRSAVTLLVDIYSNAFRVDFCVTMPEYSSGPISIGQVSESVMVHIMCVHRPMLNWRHEEYTLAVQIYHGTRYISDPEFAHCTSDTGGGIYPRLRFDSWLQFENIPVAGLPRESRLLFVLYGTELQDNGGQQQGGSTNNSNSGNAGGGSGGGGENNGERRKTKVELGWTSIQFFDFQRQMVHGNYLLSLWPPSADKYLGPAPANGTHPLSFDYPVLSFEIPHYGANLVFPKVTPTALASPRYDFDSLDLNLRQELADTAEWAYPSGAIRREVLWEKRHYLTGFPHALPKVLHAAHSWDFASLVDLHTMLYSWSTLTPLQALELFLPQYPDMEVRMQAVLWVSAMKNDQLVDFLPQLLQALKHDTYEASPMAQLLLTRSLQSPRVAHHLYWLLVHSLPGENPQNSDIVHDLLMDEVRINQARHHRRFQMLLRALLATCGEKLSARFLAQNMICKELSDAAHYVKQTKESLRQKVLVQRMETVNQILLERPTSLPLEPGLEVVGVNTRSCSYFNSNTLPLKVNFAGADGVIIPAIFKSGDDLQQDMLTLQLVRVMDKLWLSEGVDLKMVTFGCVPTGPKRGMIELVTEAETLRKIQVEWGLTGSFKDKPIAEWLARQNPSQLEYERAVENFTASCAGYSVATYILGICDRHNDNIMLKTSGHLFHIDFGKFLGDAQMFGNFKRDRTPFVLTSDMAYVINGGDRPSMKFHYFVDMCCRAFNIVRKHGDLILHMLALMATSGIPGVTHDAVSYVRDVLMPGQSNPEAAAAFAKMIHISLKSWFTQFNFFLHNLAQLRFSGDDDNGELLSFVPRTYTMAQDGRLKTVHVKSFQKRYDLEKYYTYIIQVTRQNQPDPAYLFRTYKEFLEFYQKLCILYPLIKFHSLPSGIHVGRSNIKTVAERRLPEIRLFLKSVFQSADEIAHSDVVYTFFHPLLRDQQEADVELAKVKEARPVPRRNEVCGQIKLSLQYHRGALTVMVHHVRSLSVTASGQEPNTYVKTYLKPDPSKATKRKTKVVRRNCHPSFMETLEYRMPFEFIRGRVLQATVWSHDSLQENEFLGGVELNLSELDLREEVSQWYSLSYIPRRRD